MIIFVLFQSCFMSKTVRLAKKGSVAPKSFSKELHFDTYHDLIIVDVVIDGQTFHLIYDTGAFMTVFDTQMASQLQVKAVSNKKARSSSGKAKKQQIIEVPEIEIGGIKFKDINAFVVDLSKIQKVFGCVQVDGIIGNNLMRKANWQIDYQKKTLKLTDDMNNLKVSDKVISYHLGKRKWGNSAFPIEINGVTKYFTFDTGYSGFLQSNLSFYNKIRKKDSTFQKASIGTDLGFDLYGDYTTKGTYYGYFPNLTVGDMTMKDQIVVFKDQASTLIGEEFFQNFVLTIDWDNHRALLDPVKEILPDSLDDFQLSIYPDYSDLMLKVSGSWKEHSVVPSIPNGTQILKVNEFDVSHLKKEELCHFWDVTWKDMKKSSSLLIQTEFGPTTLTKKRLLGH